jgi:glycosyltransferase involved in cell wall biosynthesis
MRIAIVLNTSWNIYNFRLGLIKALFNEGHEIVAIAPKDEYTERLIDLGCKYEEVKLDSRGANPIKDFGLTIELFNIYRRVKPDVVLHYTIKPNIYGTFAASLLGIPVVNNVCGLGTAFLNKNIVSRIAIAMYRLSFRFPKLVFFQNKDDQKFFLDSKLISNTKSDILPGSGIDINHFKPLKRAKNGRFTFLLISRLIHDKGILEYIEAIKVLKSKGVEADFQILGQIDEEHSRGIPEKLVNEWVNQGVVDYLGTTDDVRPYINNSDCIVLPSYREGTPRSLIEAASSARPIVATDVAGCNNIVTNDVNGLLCEPANAGDLASKMEAMLNTNSKKLDEMGKESRNIAVTRFDENFVIDKYLAAIAKV